MPTSDTETITAWKSKGLSEESIKPTTTPDNSLASKLKWIHNSKIRVEFKGTCLQEKATFVQSNFLFTYTQSRALNTDFTLDDYLFTAVKFTKSYDPDKYGYYGIRSDPPLEFSLPGERGGNVIIIAVDNSSSRHTDNRKKIS